MIVQIKSVVDGELPDNLTIGKKYESTRVDSERMKLSCDDGMIICTNIKKSGYLGNGGEWEVISE